VTDKSHRIKGDRRNSYSKMTVEKGKKDTEFHIIMGCFLGEKRGEGEEKRRGRINSLSSPSGKAEKKVFKAYEANRC